MEQVEIITAGLRLRPWHAADAEQVGKACRDPDIQRWTTLPVPYLPEHATAFVTQKAPAAWAAGTGAHFAVADAHTDEVLGACALIGLGRDPGTAEVGYWTAPWARRRHVALRATIGVARWGFQTLGLERITWQAEVGNHASRLVALRAGFRMEGTLRHSRPRPGGRRDGWIGSLLPHELPAGPAAPVPPDPVAAARAAVFLEPQPVLEAQAKTGLVRLRALRRDDLDAIVAMCRDPEAVRWTTVPHPYEPTDAEFFVERHAPGAWLTGTGAVFALADEADVLVGSMGLHLPGPHPDTGDVGFMVAAPYRGRGYAPAALRELCRWGFDELRLERIEWRAYVGNEPSRRVAEKAGFTVEGVTRSALFHRGVRRDGWLGALLATDL